MVENDALAQAMAWPTILPALPAPDLTDTPTLAHICGQIAAAGLDIHLQDLTCDPVLPVIRCILHDPGQGGMPGMGSFAGQACRFLPEDAAAAAILEAVQSRLTDIAGAREDITDASYRAAPGPLPPKDPAAPRPPDLRLPVPRPRDATVAIALIMDRLQQAGLDEPVAVDLAPDVLQLGCVSVLCPGLEGGPAGEGYRAGPRARAAILLHAMGRR